MIDFLEEYLSSIMSDAEEEQEVLEPDSIKVAICINNVQST